MPEITLTRKQYNALSKLALHHAIYYYKLERFPERTKTERQKDRDNIQHDLSALDTLGVPFEVQYTVLLWTKRWQNHAGNLLWVFLKSINIFITDEKGETK